MGSAALPPDPRPAMLRFFFYGTLLDSDVRRAVLPHLEGRLGLSPAELRGFRRVRDALGGYPMLIRANGSTVRGLLAEGIDREAVLRMAHFEGIGYLPAEIGVANGRSRPVRAWSFQAPHRRVRSLGTWELRHWRRREKRTLMPLITEWFAVSTAGRLESLDLSWRMRRWVAERFPDDED